MAVQFTLKVNWWMLPVQWILTRQTKVVTLGQYRTDIFNAVGNTSALIPFTIQLNDCDPVVAANAAVAFSGQADAINDNLLAIASSTNTTTATGVGIEILDNTSAILKPDGNSFSTNQNLIPGTNVLHFLHVIKAPVQVHQQGKQMLTRLLLWDTNNQNHVVLNYISRLITK